MSDKTPIQWCDSTVNPVMGCDGCELWPTNPQIKASILRELQTQFPKVAKSRFKPIVDDTLADFTATELWQRREIFIKAIAQSVLAILPKTKTSVIKPVREAYEEGYRCYAGILHLIRGSNTLDPLRKGNPGYAPTFDQVTQYSKRMIPASRLADLFGQDRPEKPWLNGSPRLIFVSDMGDALSKDPNLADPKTKKNPDSVENYDYEYLKTQIIQVAASVEGSRHIWLWLTKRPDKMADFSNRLFKENIQWPDNLVAMTSVTSRSTIIRVEKLKKVRARFKGISVEPLWDAVTLDLDGIEWCIVGGESGAHAKPFDLAWARTLHDQCLKSETAFFLKQLGKCPVDYGKRLFLKDKHGGDWDEWPADPKLRKRDLPKCFYALGSTRIAPTPTVLSPDSFKHHSLGQLAKEINEYCEKAKTHADTAKKEVNSAVEYALQAGMMGLAAKKRVGPKKFEEWKVLNCEKSRATLGRFMKMAKNISRVRQLPPGTNKRQVYLALGMIKAPEKKDKESTEKKVEGVRGLTSHIKAIADYWRNKIKQVPLAKWKKSERATLRKELSQLADIFHLLDKL